MRGRIGYAPGIGCSTQPEALPGPTIGLRDAAATGNTDMPFLWRLGWAAGGGVETPVAPHWTARLEYLYTDYGDRTVPFANNAQQFTSDFKLNEVRAGVSYHFGEAESNTKYVAPRIPDADIVNFHGQTTFTWQGYPAIRSPYSGPNSLPGGGEGREVSDATLYAGVRLWQGAQLWINPEIDQGFGLQYPWHCRVHQRRSVQGRCRISVCPAAARLHSADHRSWQQ